MLHLAHQAGLRPRVATVNHNLRAGAVADCAMVAQVCAGLGLQHDVLHWHWSGQGNVQDAARQGRYGLLADWARAAGLQAVAVAHTQDDLAETFLMRLARGSGLDGLAAMAPVRDMAGMRFIRPLLAAGRDDLRAWLAAQGLIWADDPSNDNPRFARVQMRAALPQLEQLGLGVARLAETAQHLAEARAALTTFAAQAAARIVTLDRGDVVIAADGFAELPDETRRRILQSALRYVTRAPYPPRADELSRVMAAALQGGAATLGGAMLTHHRGKIRVIREFRAVAETACDWGQIWDGRWQISGPAKAGYQLRALGQHGLSLCKDYRDQGLPYAAQVAGPAVWDQGDLVAAPLARPQGEWQAKCLMPPDLTVFAALSH